ncbi:Uncharacterised protein [uncultured archaeon]|nr:Uncharacterised protein [uncultured archaeon]
MIADKIITAAMESNEAFIREFERMLRQIVSVLRKLDAKEKLEGTGKSGFIAVIAARPVLDIITEKKLKVGDRLVTIREYSATSMEEAIIAAIKAERDGAKAVVCAPIVSSTIEKVLEIPVSIIMPRDSLLEAIELAARKMG